MDDYTDGPADERCETCNRLDPINCPCADEVDVYVVALEDLLVPLATEQTADVLTHIADERISQVRKWGVQSRPNGTGGQWVPAADEAKRITDERMADGSVTWLDILLEEVFESAAESDPESLREELVQVAAVAASWIEDIDRKFFANPPSTSPEKEPLP